MRSSCARASAFLAAGALALGAVAFGAAAVGVAGCASGSDSVPTGAAATGEPTGGGGNDASPASSGAGGAVPSSSSGEGAAAGTGSSASSAPGAGGGGEGQGGLGQGGLGQGGLGQGGLGQGEGGGPSSGGGGAGGRGPETGVVALLATGAAKVLRAAREDGAWTSTEVAGTFAASSRPAVALRSASAATGLLRGGSSTLLFATWNGSAWSGPVAVGGALTTGETPAVASSGDGVAHAAFHGESTDFHYYARHDGGGFSPEDELVSDGVVSSFGPTAAAIAVVDGAPIVAYAGADGNVYVQERGAQDWSSGLDVSGAPATTLTPAIVALAAGGGGDALLVFADTATQMHWTRLEPGGWTTPVAIEDALTADPPSLAAAADGGAVLAFRGTNGGVYATSFDGDDEAWSLPTRVVPIVTTPSTPAVATGVGGARAELAYVDGGGAVSVVRLLGAAWGEPLVLGQSGFTGVAIASAP